MSIAGLLIISPLRGVEAARGPFFEPDRPRPFVDSTEATSRVAALEALLQQLARARLYTAWLPVALAVIALLLSGFGPRPSSVLTSVGLAVLIGVLGYFRLWSEWPQGLGIIGMSRHLGIPGPDEFARAGRLLYDAAIGLPEPERSAFLGQLSENGFPLVATAARHSWSLVPSAAKAEVA